MNLDRVSYFLYDCIDNGYFPTIEELQEQFPDVDDRLLREKAQLVASMHDLSEVTVKWEGIA
jgi:Mg2+ and Co2+ transporter CorA